MEVLVGVVERRHGRQVTTECLKYTEESELLTRVMRFHT